MRRHHLVRAVVALAVLCLVATACGDDSDGSSFGSPDAVDDGVDVSPTDDGSPAVEGGDGLALDELEAEIAAEADGARDDALAAGVPDPCGLFEVDEIADVLGVDTIAEPQSTGGTFVGELLCTWQNDLGTAVVFLTIGAPGQANAQAGFDATVEFLGEDDVEVVDGLGDRAHWIFPGSLEVIDGDVVLRIQIVGGADPSPRDASIDLARRAIERLGQEPG